MSHTFVVHPNNSVKLAMTATSVGLAVEDIHSLRDGKRYTDKVVTGVLKYLAQNYSCIQRQRVWSVLKSISTHISTQGGKPNSPS